jgi:hypothetical protein
MPQLYLILPVGGSDGSIDNTLPGGRPGHVAPPIYHPGHPDHGLPSAPAHPGNRPPGSGEYPSGGPVIPPVQGPAHPWVPPAGTELPDPPAEIIDNVVIAVWNPTTSTWKVASAPPAQPK